MAIAAVEVATIIAVGRSISSVIVIVTCNNVVMVHIGIVLIPMIPVVHLRLRRCR